MQENNYIHETASIYRDVILKSSSIGAKSSVGDFSKVERSVLGEYIRIDRNNYIWRTEMKRHCYTGKNTSIIAAEVGSFVSVSWNVTIGGADHDYTKLSTHSFIYNDFDELPNVVSALVYLFDKSLYIVDIPNISIDTLLEIIRTAVTEMHLDCIILDHFGLIDGIESSSDKHERATRRLKELAMRLNIPIVTMIQLPRDNNQKELSLADIPCTMNSLGDDSDVVLFLHRHIPKVGAEQCCTSAENEDDSLQSAKIIIAKNKKGDTGHTFVGFNGSTASFENIE